MIVTTAMAATTGAIISILEERIFESPLPITAATFPVCKVCLSDGRVSFALGVVIKTLPLPTGWSEISIMQNQDYYYYHYHHHHHHYYYTQRCLQPTYLTYW